MKLYGCNPKTFTWTFKEQMRSLEKLVTTRPTYRKVPLDSIMVRPQMRKTFNEELIQILGQNIHIIGLLNPVILNQETKRGRYVLVAGERRFRAYNILQHFYPDNNYTSIPSFVFRGLSDAQHTTLQLAENSYVAPHPAEAAESYAALFKKMVEQYRTQGEKLSMAKFARMVGRSASTIRKSLEFVTLPAEVRIATKQNKIFYGVSFHLGKIQDKDVRTTFMIEAALRGWNESKAQEAVADYLEQVSSGQKDMFGFGKEEFVREREKTIVDYAGKVMHNYFISYAQMADKLMRAQRAKAVGTNIFTKRSILRHAREMEDLTKYIKGLAKSENIEEDIYKGPRISISYD